MKKVLIFILIILIIYQVKKIFNISFVGWNIDPLVSSLNSD